MNETPKIAALKTQRVNAYKTPDTIVFFIEQYVEESGVWLQVGSTYDRYKDAELDAALFNTRELLKKMERL